VRRLLFVVPLAAACGGAPSRGAASATVWQHRRLVVGPARSEATLDEVRLELDARRATLVATEKRAPRHGFAVEVPASLAFREVSRKTLRGTVTATPRGLELALSSETGEAAIFHCTYARRLVAPADALRVRDPDFTSECGNRGVWKPPATIEANVLACSSDGHVLDEQQLDFARGPGLELLGVSAECFMQGEGERLVPADGSLAPALGPR